MRRRPGRVRRLARQPTIALDRPPELAERANPLQTPAHIKPEWYFLATFEFLKYMPGHVGPLEGEEFGLLLISLGFVVWCLAPWIDRGKNRTVTIVAMAAGVAILVFLSVMTYLGHIA